MSRLTSDASGSVQVTRSANSIYTLMLICALVVLVAVAVYMTTVNNTRFGYAFPLGEQYEQSQQDVKDFSQAMDRRAGDVRSTLTSYRLDTRLDGAPAGGETP